MSTNNNKMRGSNFERFIVNKLKSTGFFPHVATSRLVSKIRDNQGIDICNVEEDVNNRLQYNFQLKTWTGQPNYQMILEGMPYKENLCNIVLHKKTVKQETSTGKKRFMTVGNYAVMSEDDFFRIAVDRERHRIAYEILKEERDELMTKVNDLSKALENTSHSDDSRYKKAYEILETYFDVIDDEDKPSVHKALEELGL